MAAAAEEAKKYLMDKDIPAMFEGLMTGLMYSRPDNPIDFMLSALVQLKQNPDSKVSWNTFIENPPPPYEANDLPLANGIAPKNSKKRGSISKPGSKAPSGRNSIASVPPLKMDTIASSPATPIPARTPPKPASAVLRSRTVTIPPAPIVLLFGGPGGRKARHAKALTELPLDLTKGLIHISVPELLRSAMLKYKDRFPEWQQAKHDYDEGSLVSNELALAVVKFALSQHPDAKAFIIEGYPRSMTQIKDFEAEIRHTVDAAIILDCDEHTLADDLAARGLPSDVAERRLMEYKNKTLPAAKYYDDQYMLHLVAGENADSTIVDEIFAVVKPLLETASEKRKDTPAVGHHHTDHISDHVAAPRTITPPPIEINKDVPVVIIAGAPGSLKSRYADELAAKYDGFVHINMGKLLREKLQGISEAELNDDWKAAADAMSAGTLVDSMVCRDVVSRSVRENRSDWGYIMQGYPRTLRQAEDMENWMPRIDMIILIDCTEQFCLSTLSTRAEEHESAGGENSRPDDNFDAVRVRLTNFKQETLPMLKYYDEKGKLKVIEGDKGLETALQDVISLVDNSLFLPQDSGSGKSLD